RPVRPGSAARRHHHRRRGTVRPPTDRPDQGQSQIPGTDRHQVPGHGHPGRTLMTASRGQLPAPSLLERLKHNGSGPVFIVLAALALVMAFLNPGFYEPPSLMAYLRAAAPLVVLAVGQYFVIVAGAFGLSVGSLVGGPVIIPRPRVGRIGE